jgi:hypothetical protein
LQLGQRLSDRLAGLVGHDLGEVVLVLADEAVPLEEPFGALARVDFLEVLEGGVGGLDGCVDVFGVVVGRGGPYLAGSWV